VIFGDARDFAIEAVVEPGLAAPSAVWGRMCIHIGAITLGDFNDNYCALYSSYRNFKYMAAGTHRLWDETFAGLSPEEIHDTVRQAIYGDDASEFTSRRFARFDFLTNWGEHFDDFSSVICSPDEGTLLILHRPYAPLNSPRRMAGEFVIASCTRSSFIAASTQFADWFESEAKRLSLTT
jgi:hypothetical protein